MLTARVSGLLAVWIAVSPTTTSLTFTVILNVSGMTEIAFRYESFSFAGRFASPGVM